MNFWRDIEVAPFICYWVLIIYAMSLKTHVGVCNNKLVLIRSNVLLRFLYAVKVRLPTISGEYLSVVSCNHNEPWGLRVGLNHSSKKDSVSNNYHYKRNYTYVEIPRKHTWHRENWMRLQGLTLYHIAYTKNYLWWCNTDKKTGKSRVNRMHLNRLRARCVTPPIRRTYSVLNELDLFSNNKSHFLYHFVKTNGLLLAVIQPGCFCNISCQGGVATRRFSIIRVLWCCIWYLCIGLGPLYPYQPNFRVTSLWRHIRQNGKKKNRRNGKICFWPLKSKEHLISIWSVAKVSWIVKHEPSSHAKVCKGIRHLKIAKHVKQRKTFIGNRLQHAGTE